MNIAPGIHIFEHELDIQAIRAQGAGGQNVNKVSSAIHLRFDITHSSLPERVKVRLLLLRDQRISKAGVLVIKAQEHRTQDKNKQEALRRLKAVVLSVLTAPKRRIATKPKRGAVKKRLDRKTKKGKVKNLRSKVKDYSA